MIIEKYLKETYGFISEISKSEIYEVQVGKTKSHSFNNRNLTLEKNEDEFCFSLSTLIKKGIDRNEELKINKETTVKLTNNKRSIYIKGKYVLVRHISYPDLDTNILEKTIKGQINSLSTENFNFYKKQRCYRIIIPIEDLRVRLTGDFTGWGFKVDSKFTSETLVKLVINKKEYHFFTNSINKKYFIVIDSMEDQSLEDFQKYANSILLAFAFLKGNYHGKEAFIFSYKSNDFKEPKSMMSTILGGGIYNGFSVHSSSPHSLMLSKKETKYKKDKEGNIIGFDDRNLRKFMVEFPAESFAKLCELICNKGGILRAVLLFVSNHSTTLELKIPSLFVALENITKVLTGGDSSVPKLIENEKIIAELNLTIKSTVKEINKIKNTNKPNSSSQELKEYNSNFDRIANKMHMLNNGTNNKKLIDPFVNLGYVLTAEEEEIILRYRNKFLHGEDYMSLDIDYEIEFRELFHMSMKLHKLISILLLKASGYSGYILNNAKIYDYISEKNIKEPIFIKI